ncbi:hypothetical protein BYT27DRAFT_7215226 [Phlegmacium glaucopus]|nr:hypothetical protein BYT27DRAFT_7215226 [Phlegmacium glaucopus]
MAALDMDVVGERGRRLRDTQQETDQEHRKTDIRNGVATVVRNLKTQVWREMYFIDDHDHLPLADTWFWGQMIWGQWYQTWTTSSSPQWKEYVDDDKTLARVLLKLELHQRKTWLAEESIFSNLSYEYLTTLLRPLVDIFNLTPPIEGIQVDFGENICSNSLAVYSLPKEKSLPRGGICSLSKFYNTNHQPLPLIIANIKDIAISLPLAQNRPEPVFQGISTT